MTLYLVHFDKFGKKWNNRRGKGKQGVEVVIFYDTGDIAELVLVKILNETRLSFLE